MERTEITNQLTNIFKELFNNDNIVLSDSMTANDEDNWDSLSHMLLISEIENRFEIKFKLRELNIMKNVGILINFIEENVNQ